MREIKFRAWDKTSKVMINEYVRIDDYGEVQPPKLYKCEYCGYETDKEEVWCWKCEKGQMLYQEQENEHFK